MAFRDKRSSTGHAWLLAAVLLWITPMHAKAAECAGDCVRDDVITVDEVLTVVNIALGSAPLSQCLSADTNSDGEITVDELLAVVDQALNGCPQAPPTGTPAPPVTATPTATGGVEEFVAQASDFECVTQWTKVRHYRVANKLGHLDEAVAVANSAGDMSGLTFPPGTIIQLIPTEAMVKRAGNFDPANHDWEYFSLATSARGTQISKRGRDEVVNFQGGNCFNCHSAARNFDFVCENNHGCVQLGLTDEIINFLQEHDPRCSQ